MAGVDEDGVGTSQELFVASVNVLDRVDFPLPLPLPLQLLLSVGVRVAVPAGHEENVPSVKVPVGVPGGA